MEIPEHVSALRREGELLAAAARRAGLRATVPACAPWLTRDLLRHQGYVHRWATGYVAGQLTEPVPALTEPQQLAAGPGDDKLIDWFREGHASLVEALRAADPGMSCWTFLDAPCPLAFWARRQAHETAIHRADAEGAGGRVPAFPPDFAADGVDELLLGFFSRGSTAGEDAAAAPGRGLQLRATDTGDEWFAQALAGGTGSRLAFRVSRGAGQAACTVAGPASGLYLLLWNRCDAAAAGLTVSGDDEVLAAWRAGMHVRWRGPA